MTVIGKHRALAWKKMRQEAEERVEEQLRRERYARAGSVPPNDDAPTAESTNPEPSRAGDGITWS